MFDYTNLDLTGVKPTARTMTKVGVHIDPTVMMDSYATAVVQEIQRINPRRYEQVPLTEEEMIKYSRFLVAQRVKSVKHEKIEWMALKQLYIPEFMQFALSQIGIVTVPNKGLMLIPQLDEDYELPFEEVIDINSKLALFKDDIRLVRDAMPRGDEGDWDTMTCALIAGYVVSKEPVSHPVATYVAAFLGFKVREEQSMKALFYEQVYDHIDYLVASLLRDHRILGSAE